MFANTNFEILDNVVETKSSLVNAIVKRREKFQLTVELLVEYETNRNLY